MMKKTKYYIVKKEKINIRNIKNIIYGKITPFKKQSKIYIIYERESPPPAGVPSL